MKAVALAGGGFGPAASAMIAAAQRNLLETDLDFETLDPAEPEELAASFTEPRQALRVILVQGGSGLLYWLLRLATESLMCSAKVF